MAETCAEKGCEIPISEVWKTNEGDEHWCSKHGSTGEQAHDAMRFRQAGGVIVILSAPA